MLGHAVEDTVLYAHVGGDTPRALDIGRCRDGSPGRAKSGCQSNNDVDTVPAQMEYRDPGDMNH